MKNNAISWLTTTKIIACWLLHEWWQVFFSVLLATAGFNFDFGLHLILGNNWADKTSDMLHTYGPPFLYITAVLVILRWVKIRFYSHNILKKELRQSVGDLNSDNPHLIANAVEEILAVSRSSRRLHMRAIEALAQYLRENHPAPVEKGRTVTLKNADLAPRK